MPSPKSISTASTPGREQLVSSFLTIILEVVRSPWTISASCIFPMMVPTLLAIATNCSSFRTISFVVLKSTQHILEKCHVVMPEDILHHTISSDDDSSLISPHDVDDDDDDELDQRMSFSVKPIIFSRNNRLFSESIK